MEVIVISLSRFPIVSHYFASISISAMSKSINGTGSVAPSRSGSEPERPMTRASGRRIRTQRPETLNFRTGAQVFSLWYEKGQYMRACSNAHIQAVLGLPDEDLQDLRQSLLDRFRVADISSTTEFSSQPDVVYPILGEMWQNWKSLLFQYILRADSNQPSGSNRLLQFSMTPSCRRALNEARQLDEGVQQRMRYFAALAANTARNEGNRLRSARRRETRLQDVVPSVEGNDDGDALESHGEGNIGIEDNGILANPGTHLHSTNNGNQAQSHHRSDGRLGLQPARNSRLNGRPWAGQATQTASSGLSIPNPQNFISSGSLNTFATGQVTGSWPSTSFATSNRNAGSMNAWGSNSSSQYPVSNSNVPHPLSSLPAAPLSSYSMPPPNHAAQYIPNVNVQISPSFNIQIGLARLLPSTTPVLPSVDVMMDYVQYSQLFGRIRAASQYQQGLDLARSVIVDPQNNMVYDDASLQDTLRGMWSTSNSMTLAIVPNTSMGFSQSWTPGMPSLPSQPTTFTNEPIWNLPYQQGMGPYQSEASYQYSDIGPY